MKIIFTLFAILLFGAASAMTHSTGNSSSLSSERSSRSSFLGATAEEEKKPDDKDESFLSKHKTAIYIAGFVLAAMIILGVAYAFLGGK